MLIFGKANSKLVELERETGLRIATFSLPAGRTCPGADECKAMVRVNADGKRQLVDGPRQRFRCFAASQEAQYDQTYNARAANLDAIRKAKTPKRIADLIVASFPRNADVIRWHVSGDFFSRDYLLGTFEAFDRMPAKRAYFYTKSAHFLADLASHKPPNVSVTASLGGKYDAIAIAEGMRTVAVVGSAEATDLPIDHDDRHALAYNTGGLLGGESFALIVHGAQAPGSWGSSQLVQLRRAGVRSGYSRKRASATA